MSTTSSSPKKPQTIGSNNDGLLGRPQLIVLLTAALLSLALAAIAASGRVPWVDEGLFSSAAFNLAHHGFMGTTVVNSADLHLTRIESHTYWVMPLYLVGQAAWLKIFPATLFAVRAFTLLWIPIALFSLFRLLLKITSDSQASVTAVCLFALSFIFIDNASFGRPDTMCCALGLAGLAAFMELREHHLYSALFVSNALIAASGLTHPNGVFHLLGLITLVLWFDRRRLSVANIAVSALPYLLFGSVWALYIFQDYPAFIDQMRGNGTNGRWSAGFNLLTILREEFRQRYMMAFGITTGGVAMVKVLALLAYVIGILGGIFQPGFRDQRPTRLFLLLTAVYFVAMSLFNQKLAYYLIHILPWYIALIALYLSWLWDRKPALRLVLGAAVIILLCAETGGILLKTRSRSSLTREEQAAIDFARLHAFAHDRIAGSAALIYGFHFDPRLIDDPRLGTQTEQIPDIVIVDPAYRDLFQSLAKGAAAPAWQFVKANESTAISKRLASYRLAFNNSCCGVYLRSQKMPAQR